MSSLNLVAVESESIERDEAEPAAPSFTPVDPRQNRFLFVDIAALRAKQLRRGARPRLDPSALGPSAAPYKAERLAMEEVRHGYVEYDIPEPIRKSREV